MVYLSAEVGQQRMLDEIDKKILQILQEDSRKPVREISKELGNEVSPSTVSRRINDMRDNGIIKKFTIQVDPEPLNLKYPICFFIETDPKIEVEGIAKDLKKNIPEIIYLHHVAGDFQLASMARCRDAGQASKVANRIAKIEGVKRIVSHSILNTFKEDTKLTFD